MSSAPNYVICDDGRRLPSGGPLKDEYYGPCWQICRAGGKWPLNPAVIVPDPGDGSARGLADRILAVLSWRPMETAPKDGTEILVADADGVYKVAWRDALDGSEVEMGWCVPESYDSSHGVFFVIEHPTHWMPLPARILR